MVRTCETIGGPDGQELAASFGRFLGARVAGHTYVIGFWQSGLHELAPNALRSTRHAPNTIHCLSGTVPRGW